MYREIEALGFTRRDGNEKNYLYGMLPMADAFITWSHSASSKLNTGNPDFTTFHLYSVGIFVICIGILWLFWGHKRKSPLHIPW